MKITLKAGERIYINGAVFRPDRKVSIELLNDVTFLLEHHILKPEDTSTPLRQLYFIVQTMIMDPDGRNPARTMWQQVLSELLGSFGNQQIREGLKHVGELIHQGKNFEALREIRSLLPVELKVISPKTIDQQEKVNASWDDDKQQLYCSRDEHAAGA